MMAELWSHKSGDDRDKSPVAMHDPPQTLFCPAERGKGKTCVKHDIGIFRHRARPSARFFARLDPVEKGRRSRVRMP